MKLLLKDSSYPIDCQPHILEKVFSITYLHTIEYADWTVEKYLFKKCQQAIKKRKIGHLAQWLGSLHGKQMKRENYPSITIRWINDQKGYGVIADQPFQSWSYLGEYTGIVRRRKLFLPNINDYCFMYPRQWLNFCPMTIDSEKAGNFTRFINHSDYPNLESLAIFFEGVMHVIFRAIKDIEKGEELTYDYGDLYWKKRKKVLEINKL